MTKFGQILNTSPVDIGAESIGTGYGLAVRQAGDAQQFPGVTSVNNMNCNFAIQADDNGRAKIAITVALSVYPLNASGLATLYVYSRILNTARNVDYTGFQVNGSVYFNFQQHQTAAGTRIFNWTGGSGVFNADMGAFDANVLVQSDGNDGASITAMQIG